MKNIAIFASGSGTNFEAIVSAVENGTLNCKIALLVCDKPNAFCVERAKNHNIEVLTFCPKEYVTRGAYEKMLVENLKKRNVELVVLAGFMRILTEEFISAFENKIINIHPALLPSFKGAHAIADAFNFGVKVFGVTIHYVNAEMDGGKIIAQESFQYTEGESVEEVETRIHKIEHVLYVETLKKLLY
ncbi:MAG: phosphoribosylglycinamide formyltransferase [Clostridia bacterium]